MRELEHDAPFFFALNLLPSLTTRYIYLKIYITVVVISSHSSVISCGNLLETLVVVAQNFISGKRTIVQVPALFVFQRNLHLHCADITIVARVFPDGTAKFAWHSLYQQQGLQVNWFCLSASCDNGLMVAWLSNTISYIRFWDIVNTICWSCILLYYYTDIIECTCLWKSFCKSN